MVAQSQIGMWAMGGHRQQVCAGQFSNGYTVLFKLVPSVRTSFHSHDKFVL